MSNGRVSNVSQRTNIFVDFLLHRRAALKVVTSEKIGGSGVISTLGTMEVW